MLLVHFAECALRLLTAPFVAQVVIAAAEEAEGAVAAKAEEVEAAQRAMEASKTGLEAQLRELEHNIDSKEALIARLTENEEQQRRLAAQYEERLAVLQAEVTRLSPCLNLLCSF
jgi:TolA-binding protein